MARCSAPWYEINISAPDNIVSACCYYAGEKDTWNDEPVDVRTYWNSQAMRAIRRINGLQASDGPNGCSTCFYFQNRKAGADYFNFTTALAQPNLSEAQRDNLKRAEEDFRLGRQEVTFTPLRIYANFGFACNLACGMCHQVPRRGANRRQVKAATLLAWREALESALDVTVIGGEPFALPEAVAFIRSFIAEPAFDAVRLGICTNGTVHHKHMEVLKRKRKLSMTISLDSIDDGYEKIRANGEWKIVEKNILKIVELQRSERPEWSLQTNALIQRTGIRLLPRFAAWHAQHGIITSFYDFINSRGTEDAFYSENVLHNPQLLDDLPEWEDYFIEAIDTFRTAKLDIAASTLDHYRSRVADAVASRRRSMNAQIDSIRGINDWEPILTAEGGEELGAHLHYTPATGAKESLFTRRDNGMTFASAREGDHAATQFFAFHVSEGAGFVRARLRWPEIGTGRRAHFLLQNENLQELAIDRDFHVLTSGSTEIALTARLTPGRHSIRLVAMPVGEDESMLPDRVELELARADLVAVEMGTPAVEQAAEQRPSIASTQPVPRRRLWKIAGALRRALSN